MMRTPVFSRRTSTSAWDSISGWHSGIRSAVFLAAAMPAMRAISSGLPLGFSGRLRSTAGRMRTKAWARAVRRVSGLADTSTMRGLPAASKCESFFIRSSSLEQHADPVAGLPVGAIGVHHHERVGARQRGHIARAAPGDGGHRGAVRAETRGQEAGQPHPVMEFLREPGKRHVQRDVLLPAQQFQRRAGEDLEGYHGGRRIAGEAEEELAARFAEYQRLAGLNQDAVEEELRAQILQHGLDDVVLTRRDAAGEQQQIGGQAAPQQFQRRAGEDLEGYHGGRRIAGEAEEELPARFAEYQRLAGLNQDAVEEELRAQILQHGVLL